MTERNEERRVSDDPTASTRARLMGAHAHYLDLPCTHPARLAVEAILGGIGDLADETVVAGLLAHADLGLSPERFEAVTRRMAKRVRDCTVTITWD